MIKGSVVLLTYIEYPGRSDMTERVSETQAWFVTAVRARPVWVEGPTARFYRELDEMKRYNAETQKKTGKWAPSGGQFLKDRPSIDQFLTDAFWDDGKPRDVCSLTIRAGAHSGSVSLNDPEQEQSISTNGESVDDALDRLEAYLAAGNPSWRPWGKKKR